MPKRASKQDTTTRRHRVLGGGVLELEGGVQDAVLVVDVDPPHAQLLRGRLRVAPCCGARRVCVGVSLLEQRDQRVRQLLRLALHPSLVGALLRRGLAQPNRQRRRDPAMRSPVVVDAFGQVQRQRQQDPARARAVGLGIAEVVRLEQPLPSPDHHRFCASPRPLFPRQIAQPPAREPRRHDQAFRRVDWDDLWGRAISCQSRWTWYRMREQLEGGGARRQVAGASAVVPDLLCQAVGLEREELSELRGGEALEV
eukprot:315824-Rhodomonas_salina.3